MLIAKCRDEAQRHVAEEGNVPIVTANHMADQFRGHTMSIVIEAPQYGTLDRDSRKFVLLADDIPTFCRMWYFSDLSYAGDLNPHLRLALDIRNPLDEVGTEPLPVSVALQKRLMLPFGAIKNLRELKVTGPAVDPDVDKAMRDAMAVAYETPEQCLENATKLKDEGNLAIKKGQPKAALDLYLQAFEKLHVVNEGRKRYIWGDAWFHKQLRGGPYDGQYGQGVRVILRVRLVANVLRAYNDMKDWEEAEFWGERTIGLVRGSVGINDDEPIVNFGATQELGKIYFRTGLACKNLGKRDTARRYFRTAHVYIPHDARILTELQSVAPPLL
jgi:tetratricopeptide (TPR) repeat protein